MELSSRMCTNLVDIEDLAGGLLHLTHLVHEVPESGLSSDLVASEQLHSVGRRVLIGGSRGLSAHNLVQFHLRNDKQYNRVRVELPRFWLAHWHANGHTHIPEKTY